MSFQRIKASKVHKHKTGTYCSEPWSSARGREAERNEKTYERVLNSVGQETTQGWGL